MTQANMVLDHMINHGFITSMEAFGMYGITRLSARIYELREAGHNILTVNKTCKNRYGHSCTYSEYRLVKEG